MAETDVNEALERFLVWFKNHGGYLHQGLVVSYDESDGICVRRSPLPAKYEHDLQQGDPVIRCPHSLSMSSMNAVNAGFQRGQRLDFPEKALKDGGPRLLGAAYLCVQRLLGQESFWYHYLNILPRPRGGSYASGKPMMLSYPGCDEAKALQRMGVLEA